jgi:hypothetical protein
MSIGTYMMPMGQVWRLWPFLFWLLAASGHQKLLRTAKRSAFQPASIKFVGAKTIQNQHKHIISWVVVIVGICHFLDPEPYEQLYLPPHIIVMILKFSPQPDSSHSQIFRKAGQKKAEPKQALCCIYNLLILNTFWVGFNIKLLMDFHTVT